MTDDRVKQIEDKATEYRNESFRLNPSGFHVSPYCNEDSLSNAFQAGAEWADANPLPASQILMNNDQLRREIKQLQSDRKILVEALKCFIAGTEQRDFSICTTAFYLAKEALKAIGEGE